MSGKRYHKKVYVFYFKNYSTFQETKDGRENFWVPLVEMSLIIVIILL